MAALSGNRILTLWRHLGPRRGQYFPAADSCQGPGNSASQPARTVNMYALVPAAAALPVRADSAI